MLGRTDSRRRLLFLLVVFVVGLVALVARTAYWQVLRGDELTASAVAQTTVPIEIARSPRRHLRPDRHRPPGHDRRPRPARRGGRPARRRPAGARPADDPGPPARPRRGRARRPCARGSRAASRTSSSPAASTPRWPSGSGRPARDEQVVGISLEPEPERVYPQAGGGPDSTLAAHLLGFVNRENVGPVRRRAVLPGGPGRRAARRSSPSATRAAGPCRRPRSSRPGVAGEDLRLTIDAGLQLAARAGAPGGVDRRRGQERLGRGHGPVHRRDLRRGDLPVVRRQRLSRRSRPPTRPLHRPGRVARLRAGLGVQDDDRDRGPGGGHGHAARRKIKDIGTLKLDGGKTQDRQRRPQGHGLDHVRGRHRLLPQRRRGQGRPRPRRLDRRRRRRCSTTSGAGSASARRPASTSPARSPASCATRPITPWREIDLANGSFGQGVAVTPIQLATAFAAMRQRRHARSSRTSSRAIGAHDVAADAGRPGRRGRPSAKNVRRLMDHVIDEVPFYRDRTLVPGYHVGGKTGTAQIWDADANRAAGLEAQPLQLLVRRIHRPRERPSRTSSSPSASRRARRPSPASASWRCRSCRSSCSGASPPTPSRRPTC